MSYNYNIYKELEATKQSICASLNEVKNKMPLPNEYEKQITKLTNDIKALKDVSKII